MPRSFFYPHASPERDMKEAHAEKYWEAKGRRSRLECKPSDKFYTRNYKQKDPTQWYFSFVLPSEPTREELILSNQKSTNDAVEFLNKPDSEVPQAILDAGCCLVLCKKFLRTKGFSTWHVIHKHGMKTEVMELFGLKE